ncbi:MAG TPA: hypothetical protein VME46_22900 [Acidimicrobiales bacterium]|nr:hypothetical protein [Acidimicrobiales bacterium]
MAQLSRAALQLSWQKCGDDGHWCDFLKLDLSGDPLANGGVYVIWSEDAKRARKETVWVGQGKPIADCIARHRKEPAVIKHATAGRVLRVTWAKVAKELRGGVEHYLGNALGPVEGHRWSDDEPVPVNLPW